jgi:NAD(P)-dependent dehydrogenase (short-subunit alcohol dehydrogenase family)
MTGNDRRVAIITGGSQGIGASLVAGYLGRGWAVVANARTIGPSADPDMLTVEGDIAKPATADRIVEGALERFGRIDTLVNNAGVFVSKPFTDYTAADYALLTGVNLGGFFWLTQRVIAEMVRRYGGHVVNISAALAEIANSYVPSVLAALTKGGLAAATRSLAVEYASHGIRVNAVSPAPSRLRYTRRTATRGSVTSFPRSAASARSAMSSRACCSLSPRPTSPGRSCTSTVARPLATSPAVPVARAARGPLRPG